MSKNYQSEWDGQVDFYSRIGLSPDFAVNSDGVYKGVLFENKLTINNIGAVLSQLIRYASKLRLLGKPLPYYLIANDLNREIAYIFKSGDYLDKIEETFDGAASYQPENIVAEEVHSIKYNSIKGLNELTNLITKEKYTKYHVDFFNIIGLAREYYKQNPNKDDFLDLKNGEIRKPKLLADRIIPYTKSTNKEFEKVMDCLNTKLQQKELGAFFTPEGYVKLSQKMLIDYIEQHVKPKGKDYVVIDTCAGVGNLESGLPDEILSHCILSTLEPNEYLVLQENFGDKCLVVVPPVNALSYDIIPTKVSSDGKVLEDVVREKVNDPNCIVIMYENPPYSEVGGDNMYGTKRNNNWKESFVCKEMKKEHKGVISNDLANLFIWKAFKYYCVKPDDCYIVYSPAKYFKSQNLINKYLFNGYILNRKHFHATPGVITCCQWLNRIPDANHNNIPEFTEAELTAFDIDSNNEPVAVDVISVKKVYHKLSEGYPKCKIYGSTTDGILCELNGKESNRQYNTIKTYSDGIIGYLASWSFNISPKNISLTRVTRYDGHGFHLTNGSFLEGCVMFCAGVFPKYKWTDDIYNKTFDSLGIYRKDENFLKKCLIYTCLSFQNKCRSFYGSDGRYYSNQLTFTETARNRKLYPKTSADLHIQRLGLIKAEKNLMDLFIKILEEIKSTDEYNEEFIYGTWQIMDEINIKEESGKIGRDGKPVLTYKYPILNTMILELKRLLREYYAKHLVKDLFKYELVK